MNFYYTNDQKFVLPARNCVHTSVNSMMIGLLIVYLQSNWTALRREWTKSMLTCEKQKRTSLAWKNAVDCVYCPATSKLLSACYQCCS